MRLRSQEIRVAAPQELVFDVIASAGKRVGETEDAQLIEFESEWRGRVFKTVEAVSLDRPRRISYSWVMGPVIGVQEEIALAQTDARTTKLSYRGSFQPSAGLVGWFRSVTVVRPIFNKLVKDHLREAKRLSEARALRSKVYPS